MERYYHVWKKDCSRIANEINDWIAKYNHEASMKGFLEIERSISTGTSTESLIKLVDDAMNCFDVWDRNTGIDLSEVKLATARLDVMLPIANRITLADVTKVVEALENIVVLVNELLVYREVYQNTLFHISEDNLLKLETNNKDLYEAFCNMPCRRVSIETEVVIGNVKYLALCTMQPTYKNEPKFEGDTIKSKPAYYRFATDLYNKKTELFEHLSYFYLKKDSDKLWMHHCTDKLHKELDTATIFCQGHKENVQLGSFSDLSKTKFEISDNEIARHLETPTDTLSCALIRQLIMAASDYDRITSEPETVIMVQSKKTTKQHKPSEVSKNVEVLEQDRYIPMSSLHRVRKLYEKKEWQGGHHNSPIPHDVSGHWRVYKNGKKIWVNPYHKECKGYQEVHKIIEVGK